MTHIESIIEGLKRCINESSEAVLQEWFSNSFASKMPLASLMDLFKNWRSQFGACTDCQFLGLIAGAAQIQLNFESGTTIEGRLVVEASEGPPIAAVSFGFPSYPKDSWDDLLRDLQALPGEVSFEAKDLSSDRTLRELNAKQELGAGSTSKLLIFALGLEAISAGRLHWEDIYLLHDRDHSLPTGVLHTWPVEAPLTLASLFIMLLSGSDNTAADLLLRVLDRERVKQFARQHELEISPDNWPFLSTRGLFNLLTSKPELQAEYRAAPEAERLTILNHLESVRPSANPSEMHPWPSGFDWYLSARAVNQILDQIHRMISVSEFGKKIFGMNSPGLSSDRWDFAGYKGGSSPGRLALSVLLHDQVARWFSVSLIVNMTTPFTTTNDCAMLMRRATDLAYPS